jgi:hypothetical protein
VKKATKQKGQSTILEHMETLKQKILNQDVLSKYISEFNARMMAIGASEIKSPSTSNHNQSGVGYLEASSSGHHDHP